MKKSWTTTSLFSVCRASLVAALILLRGMSCTQAVEEGALAEISLKNGNLIRATLVQERPDRYYVDVGFTLLSIPRDDVLELRVPGDSLEETSGMDSGSLYFTDSGRPTLTVRDNVKRCGEAVVQIRSGTGLGSGFLIDRKGHVVTNNHVISGEQELLVSVFRMDGDELERIEFSNVRIMAMSSLLDLALLRIEDDRVADLTPLPIGDSDRLAQGQVLFAIGSPLGLERTVSEGILSLRNREFDGRVYIQTTVQINPGNSGGPLLNLQGEVVGVNNMKAASVGVEGLAFAIPSNILKFFLHNRDAFAFDPRNPNAGFKYTKPPGASSNP